MNCNKPFIDIKEISDIKESNVLYKYDARKRIELILDKGSFIEFNHLLKDSCVITGYGTIDGKLVYVYSQDYNNEGALINCNSADKIIHVIEMALKMGAPLIQIIDSAGIKINEGFQILKKYCEINNLLTKANGVIPQVALILGPCVGMMAVMASMSDFVITLKDKGMMNLNSYENIISSEGKYIDKNRFNSDNVASITLKTEDECINVTRKIIQYIPSNNKCRNIKSEDSNKDFFQEELENLKERPNINLVINKILDENSAINLYLNISNNTKTVLGKINGITVGIFSGSDKCLNIKDINKITRFVKLCDSYHIPIISLVDTDGFEESFNSENEAIYFELAKLNYVIQEANSPKIALIIGKCYGISYLILGGRKHGFDITYAWPKAKLCLSKPEDIIKKIKIKEILQAEKPKEKEQELINQLTFDMVNPYKAAEQGIIDDVIKPKETRARLYMILDMLQTKKELKYKKNHGSMLI